MNFLKQTFTQFSEDNCTTLAASLAYYTVFALPPMLFLLLMIVTFGMSVTMDKAEASQRAERVIEQQAAQLLGNQSAADEIQQILENNQRQGGVWWKSLLSLAGIVFGATGLVAAMQASLNRVWQVQPDPEAGGLKNFLVKRMLSLAMILGLGFLLVVSLILSSVLTALGDSLGQQIGMQQGTATAINYGVTFLITALFFAAMFKFMPDATVAWRDVWVGAIVTTILFTAGRFALGLYFQFAEPGAQLGAAAASLAVLLVWVYYSSMIFLYGAEFTQAWATAYGRGISPESGAVRVVTNVIRGPKAAH